jgi:hypothetical protein
MDLPMYDPESKQWLSKGGGGPVKFKAEKYSSKVMATIFWDT